MARVLLKTQSSSSIGSVKQSMLDLAQFQTKHGTGWVLMNGTDVTGSDYATLTGQTVLPDARGRFLRSKDIGATGTNPDGDLALGAVSVDKTKANGLSGSTNTTGSHTHSVNNNTAAAGGSNNSSGGAGFNTSFQTGSAGSHSHTVTIAGGGNETAPVSLTINTFIKINEAS